MNARPQRLGEVGHEPLAVHRQQVLRRQPPVGPAQLAQAGYASEAKRVARRIGYAGRRKETLEQLSKKPDDAADQK